MSEVFKQLPKELRKRIFNFMGPPTSPAADLVKGEAFQDLQCKIESDWRETWLDYRHVQKYGVILYYPEWLWNLSPDEDITDNAVLAATYEAFELKAKASELKECKEDSDSDSD